MRAERAAIQVRDDYRGRERFGHSQSDDCRPVELRVTLRVFPLSLNQSPPNRNHNHDD